MPVSPRPQTGLLASTSIVPGGEQEIDRVGRPFCEVLSKVPASSLYITAQPSCCAGSKYDQTPDQRLETDHSERRLLALPECSGGTEL